MKHVLLGLGLMGLSAVIMVDRVNAQAVVSDGTLNTIVTQSGNTFTIDNGTASGSNLFHSFREFSIPSSGSAIFNNAPTIQNIFSRVTGGTVSNIDGTIQASGNANLFLLNPSGILFGANASLNIGGSFVGTTANSIKFADGFELSAVNATTPTLLTISVPIGLQMGQNSGQISVQGAGHNILHPTIFLPASPSTTPSLSVSSGKTLALLANQVTLDGGQVQAPSGRVDLGSVREGLVQITPTAQGWELGYSPNTVFNDIALTNAALISATGIPGGSIQVRGHNISLRDSSQISIQNLGAPNLPALNAGALEVKASGQLTMGGILPGKDQPLIISENLGVGNGADLFVSARQADLADGSMILSSTFLSGGRGGNLNLQIQESFTAQGYAAFDPTRTSGIATVANPGGGQAGNLNLAVPKLSLRDGGIVTSLVIGGARGGDVAVTADEIEVISESLGSTIGSTINSATLFGGDAGQITINTRTLALRSGGYIGTATTGAGNVGNLRLNASESIVVEGKGTVSLPSRILAAGDPQSPIFQVLFNVPPLPTGNSGNLLIQTPSLRVQDGAQIVVGNLGEGATGSLEIRADNILLDRDGMITASSRSGQGGDIALTVRNSLLLRNGSQIIAQAGETGSGGNVTINAPIIVGLENSDIIANANGGRGGKIDITTQGIIGLEFRNTQTPRTDPTNDITASSGIGLNGSVQINNIGVDPNSGLVELPTKLSDSTQQIAKGCQGTQGSSFIVTGRGGMPKNPAQEVSHDRTWNDVRDLSAFHKAVIAQTPMPTPMIVQATDWRRNPQTGKVELIAAQPIPSDASVTCEIASESGG